MPERGQTADHADALVVGVGLAGAVAALELRRAGLSVRVVADGGGATEFSSGALGLSPDLEPPDLARLLELLPGAFAVREDRAPIRAATAAGHVVAVRAAPPETLDLGCISAGRVAVAGADLSGAPDLEGLVALLVAASGGAPTFVALRVPLVPHDDLALTTPGQAAGRLANDEALVDELVRKAVRGAREAGVEAVLVPSWVPASAVRRVTVELGKPAGRMLGSYGTVPGGRELARAIRSALQAAGVDVISARVRELRREGATWVAHGDAGPLARASVAIVATGGAAGGGLRKEGRVFAEPEVGGSLVFGGEPLRQESASLGPAADAFLPARLFEGSAPRSVGIEVDERLRPRGAPEGLYLAGALAVGEGAEGGGLCWAVRSGLRAGREGAEGRGERGGG